MSDSQSEALPAHLCAALATLVELATHTADSRLMRGPQRLPSAATPSVRDETMAVDPSVHAVVHRSALVTNTMVRQRSLADFLR